MAARRDPLAAAIGRRVVGAACRRSLRRDVDLRVEGLEHVPRTGPVLLAARHFHHLYDGCALTVTLARPVQILVALDWTRPGPQRRLLERACGVLGWPTILRVDAPANRPRPDEATRYLRRATRDGIDLLRSGRVLLVFPEGYPNVDPHPTPKADEDAFLPFQPGFVRFAAMAERDGRTRVPIVPTGFAYERGPRWRATLRFGPPCSLAPGMEPAALARVVEARVRDLSRPG